MRNYSIWVVFAAFSLCTSRLGATDHYVSLTSPSPAPPYTSWNTAAHVIQDAIDAANPGDTVNVTNGIYNTGGTVVYGTLTNRVAITKPLTVQSVNGPAVTTIEGYQVPGTTNGPGAVRCVYMTNDTTLIGFTITHGANDKNYDSGGGVFCENFTNSVLSNCVITANFAYYGGGVIYGTLNDCVISSNSASGYGGGIYYSTLNRCKVVGNYAGYRAGGGFGNSAHEGPQALLNSCTLIGNSAPIAGGGADTYRMYDCILIGNQSGQGGGAEGCWMVNCTVVSNSAPIGAGTADSVDLNSIVYYNNGPDIEDVYGELNVFYTCTPVIGVYSTGCFTNAPTFVNLAAGDFHLQPNSPCINSGSNSNLTMASEFILGQIIYIPITNDFAGNPRLVGENADAGAYEFQGNIRYVNLNSTNPIPPYSDWTMAATSIQDAIDAANPGDFVLVTNGVYAAGGTVVYGTLTNRVAITKPLTVQSVNGPAVTTIEGYQVPGTTNGPGAVRGVYMTNDTTLIGFTITRGATDSEGEMGGGVRCENMTNSVLSNCVIIANSALADGGGVWSGTLNDCLIASNSVPNRGGGIYQSSLNRCKVVGNYAGVDSGGGSGNSGSNGHQAWLNSCTIVGNSSLSFGGGVDGYRMYNCILIGNQSGQGGGAEGCWMVNCTVVSNSAPIGAGTADSVTLNSIVYYNNGPDLEDNGFGEGNTLYTCTPIIGLYSFGSFTTAPAFVNLAAEDFHLQPNSPCINSGNNSNLMILSDIFFSPFQLIHTSFTNDFDGNPRAAGGTVDMGAYEVQSPASVISYAWLQHYGFATDGSADYADPDGDRMNNFQEWRANTIPTDAASLLQMQFPVLSPSGTTLTWQSQANTTYYVQRNSDLSASFSIIQSNIIGQPGITSYMDTNATGNGPFFYRVGVQ